MTIWLDNSRERWAASFNLKCSQVHMRLEDFQDPANQKIIYLVEQLHLEETQDRSCLNSRIKLNLE